LLKHTVTPKQILKICNLIIVMVKTIINFAILCLHNKPNFYLSMKNTLLSLMACLLLLSAQAYAQDRAVTGKVTADDGSVLPGVNISLKGTNRGTTTDSEGAYSITAASGATLVFSFIGFQTQEAVIGSLTTINITLKNDVSQLQEVVVTALGQQRKRNELVYAAQQVTAEQITQTPWRQRNELTGW
jgi:hypothetical protein